MVTPKEQEQQWFLENEKKVLEQARRQREERLKEREAEESAKALEERKTAHWMKCPKCGHDMQVKKIEHIEIDECTFCEGIFFDRGELDELLLAKTSQRSDFFRNIFGLK